MIREAFIKLMERIEVQSELVNSWTKHLLTTQSALVIAMGFLLNSTIYNSSLKIFFIFFVPAVGILSARMLKRIIIRQLQWEGEYIRQIRNLEDYGVPAIFEKTDRYKNPFEGKGFIASEISLFCELLTRGWITIAFVLFIYMV